MQYWDNVLYPPFRATIRGEYYGVITEEQLDEECFFLAQRAVAAFKFPKISTEYKTFYAVRNEDNEIEEVDIEDCPDAVKHAYFVNDLTYAEIEILIAWMKVYWCENQISNADNFEDIYTDANIKTYSRANAVDKNMKLMAEYRSYAQELETRYSRVNNNKKPTMADINIDED